MSIPQHKQNAPLPTNPKNQSSNQKSNKKKLNQIVNQKQNIIQKESFLSKFKDKHSIISKEGLISLLQNKKKQIKNFESILINKITSHSTDKFNEKLQKIPKKSNQQLKQYLKNSQIKQIQQEKIGQIIKSRSLRKNSDSSVSKSVQLYEVPKKLPILHKIPSYTHQLRKKDSSTPVSDIHSVARTQNFTGNYNPIKKNSLKIQVTLTKKADNFFQLDRYALDHLDFLQKFQERIKAKER